MINVGFGLPSLPDANISEGKQAVPARPAAVLYKKVRRFILFAPLG